MARNHSLRCEASVRASFLATRASAAGVGNVGVRRFLFLPGFRVVALSLRLLSVQVVLESDFGGVAGDARRASSPLQISSGSPLRVVLF